MKKKWMLIIILLFVFIGCTQKPESVPEPVPEPEIPKTVKKLDEGKEYIYVGEVDTNTLEPDEIQDFLGNFYNSVTDLSYKQIYYPNLQKENVLANQRIIINIDSIDANEVQKTLDSDYENDMSLRAENLEKVESETLPFFWNNNSIYDWGETEDTIYVAVYRSGLVAYSERQYEYVRSYVFDRNDGKLLSEEEILERAGITMDSVKSQIQKDFEEPIKNNQDQPEKYAFLVDEIDEDIRIAITQTSLNDDYYTINHERGIYFTNETLFVPLDVYTAMDDEFASKSIHAIPLGS